MSPSKPLRLGNSAGAEFAFGITGGAGGGGTFGASLIGSGGAGGAGLDASTTRFVEGEAGLLDVGDLALSSIADKGLGGAIVPNRIEARCLALPRSGRSGSSSSDEEDSVESTTDHSSSSLRTLLRLPVGVDVKGSERGWDLEAEAAAVLSC